MPYYAAARVLISSRANPGPAIYDFAAVHKSWRQLRSLAHEQPPWLPLCNDQRSWEPSRARGRPHYLDLLALGPLQTSPGVSTPHAR